MTTIFTFLIIACAAVISSESDGSSFAAIALGVLIICVSLLTVSAQ